MNKAQKLLSVIKEEDSRLGYYYKGYGIGWQGHTFFVFDTNGIDILKKCMSELECKEIIDNMVEYG